MLPSDSESDPYSDLSTQGLRVNWRFISRPISSLSVWLGSSFVELLRRCFLFGALSTLVSVSDTGSGSGENTIPAYPSELVLGFRVRGFSSVSSVRVIMDPLEERPPLPRLDRWLHRELNVNPRPDDFLSRWGGKMVSPCLESPWISVGETESWPDRIVDSFGGVVTPLRYLGSDSERLWSIRWI